MSDSQELKTELPTSKRLKDAIKAGNVVVSREVYNFFILIGCFLLFLYFLPKISKELLPYLRGFVVCSWDQSFRNAPLCQFVFLKPLIAVLPVFLLFILLSLVANFLHHRRFVISFKPLAPNFNRLSLVAGCKRLFSKRAGLEAFKALIKIALVACVFYPMCKSAISSCSLYFSLPSLELLRLVKHKAALSTFVFCLLFSFIAGLDYFFQVRSYINSMRMTKRELLQEYRDTEGDPQVKRRIRVRMAKLAKVVLEVERADLVVVDPGKLAVVLKHTLEPVKVLQVKCKAKSKAAIRVENAAKSVGAAILVSKDLADALYFQLGLNSKVPEGYCRQILQDLHMSL